MREAWAVKSPEATRCWDVVAESVFVALLLAMPYAWVATKLTKQTLILVATTSTAAQYASFYGICM